MSDKYIKALKGRYILPKGAALRITHTDKQALKGRHTRMKGAALRITQTDKQALKGRYILPKGAALRITEAHTMGQSLVKNYLHIVFSTKYRQPLIHEPFEQELHAYIGGVCNEMECTPIKVGGYTDHIHILCMLSKKIALMKLLEEVKSHSSKWFKTKDDSLRNFYWQDGYGAFSVNPAEVDIVIGYIANQKEHHRKKNFQDEYRAFLKKYKVDYDERYVWD